MITEQENASLKNFNTFGIDTRCRKMIEYSSPDDLTLLRDRGVFDSKWMMLGAGANTLFDCDFYDGAILRATSHLYCEEESDSDKFLVKVGAGWIWDQLVEHMLNRGIAGAENLSGIPATLGGAIVQNIGAYGQEISNLIEKVEVFDTRTGEVKTLDKSECGFAYRTSIFKRNDSPLIVTAAVLKLSVEDQNWHPCIAYAPLQAYYKPGMSASDIREWVIKTRNSKLPDPKVLGNAGSFFVNPVVSEEIADRLASEYPEMPRYKTENGVKLAAGWLIDHAGLRGYRRGQVGVDRNNALVLVNYGNATGADVLQLARHIIDTVNSKYGVELHPEVRIIK